MLAQGDRAGVDLVAQDGTGSKVDLLQEEQNGGHTLEKHVGMSDDYLLNRIATEQYGNWIYSERLASAGSFYSLDQANALTNATLNLNSATVNSVANGNFGTVPQVIESTFTQPTGKEAYADMETGQAFMRTTYSTRVVIRYNPNLDNGFYVLTAYPITK